MKHFIKINGLRWTFYFVASEDEHLYMDNQRCFGVSKFDELSVYINVDLEVPLLIRTLRHELTHVYLFSYGFSGEELSEEGICNFVECYGQRIMEDSQYLASTNILKNQEKELKISLN
ncbi:hypothetical protein EII25_01705 [Erysipelotrichaceae bacterium OH741_COT-311]|nr:hypothetical protein [Erysipelotrichaceae bacterium]RRC93644.1 hypothetical protein EII25_01705 [Erysipelotrichaceae bacterium OH741_COT-311]